MPLTPSFTATQSLANPNRITIIDTSTGSDGTITNRKVYIKLASGNWLTEDGESTTETYMNWNYALTSITLDILSQSTAAEITVVWLAGSTIVYESTDSFCFNLYDYIEGLQLLQGQTSNPGIVQDVTYYSNLMNFIVNIFNEENAITYAGDIFSSQAAMAKNYMLTQNEAMFF